MTSGQGSVKEVLSGDTIVVMGAARGGPPPTMQLSLANLRAPRLGRGAAVKDQPMAWESREFLRRKLIGKTVDFNVEYKVEQIGRTFATIKIGGKNIALEVAEQGWARVEVRRGW